MPARPFIEGGGAVRGIDGNRVFVHLLLKHKFGLPNFYGRNWNALWDLLEDECYSQEEPLVVEMKNFHCIPKDMQEYCEGMFGVFDDIHEKFPQVTFKKLS